MMSSRQPITLARLAMPCLINSCALPNQTSVPWERPEIWSNSAKVLGFVSSNIPRTNVVPISGTPKVPVLEKICSGVTPRTSVPAKIFMTSGSSIGMVEASIPDKSCNLRIMVGSSWPRISSLRILSWMAWKSK